MYIRGFNATPFNGAFSLPSASGQATVSVAHPTIAATSSTVFVNYSASCTISRRPTVASAATSYAAFYSGQAVLSARKSIASVSAYVTPRYAATASLSRHPSVGVGSAFQTPRYTGVYVGSRKPTLVSTAAAYVSGYIGNCSKLLRPTVAASGVSTVPAYGGACTLSRHPSIVTSSRSYVPTYSATANVGASHSTIASSATRLSPSYSGAATLSRHPGIGSMGGPVTADYYGSMGVFATKAIVVQGTRGTPTFAGVAAIVAPHPTIGATSIGGLFGWWNFASVIGGYDSTNLMNSATLLGTATAGDGFLHLDGTSGSAVVSDDPFDMGTSSFSLVVRAKPSLIDGSYRTILSKRSNSSYRGWSLYIDPTVNKFVFEMSDTGSIPFFRVVSSTSPSAGTEYHIVVVLSRETNLIRMFVNGVSQPTTDITGVGSLNNTIPFTFGNEVGQSHWAGTLRDIRFYKKGLSLPEVATLAAGQNLYGDIPVFGTLTVPTYTGSATCGRNAVFAAVGSRMLPSSGTMSGTARATIAASGTGGMPTFGGRASLSVRTAFASNDTRVSPAYAGSSTLNTHGMRIVSTGYTSNAYKVFIYEMISYL